MTAVIRIDVARLDMRAGTDSVLARVVKVFGAAQPHHAYVFANNSASRIKVLVYDGFGLWLSARRLNRGRFVCADQADVPSDGLNTHQLSALVTGLRWKTLAHSHAIAVV
jgi:transposase